MLGVVEHRDKRFIEELLIQAAPTGPAATATAPS